MTQEGLHLDVAGGGEILGALRAGADPATLVFHGNAKTDEELQLAVRHGVGLVVVDNFDDIDRLERLVPRGRRQQCLVRVIPGVEATTHVGSQLLDVDQLAEAVAPIAALGAFDTYDRGGGLGVRYTYGEHEPWLDEYADAMIGQARELLPPGCRIIVEPGRSMVAAAACTVYRVTTVKQGKLKHGEVTHVAVDGGMGDNLEASLTASGSRRRSSTGSAAGDACPS